MADSITNIKKTVPVSIPKYDGTLSFTLDGDAAEKLNIIKVQGVTPIFDEQIEPGAGEIVTLTVSVKGKLETS